MHRPPEPRPGNAALDGSVPPPGRLLTRVGLIIGLVGVVLALAGLASGRTSGGLFLLALSALALALSLWRTRRGRQRARRRFGLTPIDQAIAFFGACGLITAGFAIAQLLGARPLRPVGLVLEVIAVVLSVQLVLRGMSMRRESRANGSTRDDDS